MQPASLLQDIDTRTLWRYFIELSRIPRGSRDEAAAANWVAEQGLALGCEVKRDAVGNVLIRKPARPGRESRPIVALQAHVDMVCEKNEGTAHDFLHDPIRLIHDGDDVCANGTTLGADNGIGVSAALAILAATNVAHGPLEVLITVDEETGLTGANNLQFGWLQARYLLNLDSEEEGYLTIGCAGGVDTIATRNVTWEAPSAWKRAFRLKVSGLKGGHSGEDIAKGRGNAIRILALVIRSAIDIFGLEVSSVNGGNKRNAIPREASAVFFMDAAKTGTFEAALRESETHWKAALGAFDPGLRFDLDAGSAERVLSSPDANALLQLLLVAPHGAEEMSPEIPTLVQTSTNLAVVETGSDAVQVVMLTRSALARSKAALTTRVSAACSACGFEYVFEGDYPGWKPEPGNSLVKSVSAVHESLFGKPMQVVAVHGGLECGLIGEKHPGMEMVSLGPNMWDVHTPDERVSVRSVAAFWKLLTRILETL